MGASWLTPRIYGPGYAPAGPVLAVLGAAVACAMLGHLLGMVLLAADQPRRFRAIAALAFVASLGIIPAGAALAGAFGGAVAVLLVEGVTLGAGLVAVRGLAGWLPA